ncbi:MAG: hypothetical protein D6725_07920 [Planctomycetota bacterium]|nr:MAG: hypothetical protein D6725_07920 [Planctomycetota bacterium]
MSDALTAVQLFMFLAVDTWQNLCAAHELKISYGEETITNSCLLEMKRARLRTVVVRQFTKHEEASWGADWEWWIRVTRGGWVRYAVQAKKIAVPTARYPTLRHKVKDSKCPGYQIDRLDWFANACRPRAVPAYCFYNYVDIHNLKARDVSLLQHRLRSAPLLGLCPPAQHHPERLLGCTVAHLEFVKTFHARGRPKDFLSIHLPALYQGDVLPWHELLLGLPRSLVAPGPGQPDQPYIVPAIPRAIADFALGRTDRVPLELYPRGGPDGPASGAAEAADVFLPKRLAILEMSNLEEKLNVGDRNQ